MPWWGWITIGALLLTAEMTFVDLDFYLVFLGTSALIVGLIGLADFPLPFWTQWILFALLGIGSLVLFRQRFYARLHPPPDADVQQGVDGAWATALDSIAPGERGAVTLRGTTWTGRNVGSEMIPSGAACRVERSEGLLLELRLDSEGGV